jgi:hypothetical protein
LERTGGEVSKVKIFERRDLPSCVKEKSYFKFDVTTYQIGGGLTFLFAGNESFIH